MIGKRIRFDVDEWVNMNVTPIVGALDPNFGVYSPAASPASSGQSATKYSPTWQEIREGDRSNPVVIPVEQPMNAATTSRDEGWLPILVGALAVGTLAIVVL